LLKGIYVRLYPSTGQEAILASFFGSVRFIFNNSLQASKDQYAQTGKGLSGFQMTARLPKLKEEFPWLKDVHSQVLQASCKNLDRAFQNFFAKRAKFPKFKSKHTSRQSIQYPQGVKVADKEVFLPKIGWVKAVVHRELVGEIKTCTVSTDGTGRYHVSILTEDGCEPPSRNDGTVLGIDLGLTDLVTTSTGYKSGNPKHLKQALRNLRKKQKALSRKRKGSNNRRKAKRLVARVHARVANVRKDFLHNLSHEIVRESQATVIAAESLNVKGMQQNKKLAKVISDAGWSLFLSMIAYKCTWEGKTFVQIGQWFPSSKTCSCCGSVQPSLPLNVRAWTCPDCGSVHDRDHNAAINIGREGLKQLAVGATATACGGMRKSRKVRKDLRAAA
jgi:putative transposase